MRENFSKAFRKSLSKRRYTNRGLKEVREQIQWLAERGASSGNVRAQEKLDQGRQSRESGIRRDPSAPLGGLEQVGDMILLMF